MNNPDPEEVSKARERGLWVSAPRRHAYFLGRHGP